VKLEDDHGTQHYDVGVSLPISSNGDLSTPAYNGNSSSTPQWKKRLTASVATLLQGREGGGRPIPYLVIRSRFPFPLSGVSDEALIEALSACAVLVRGNFVLKSSLLPFTNRHIQDARDLILLLLNKYGFVQREKLIQVYSRGGNTNSIHKMDSATPGNENEEDLDSIVTADNINAILDIVGRKTLNGMELKIDDDFTLDEHFPHLVRRHAEYWLRKEARLAKLVTSYERLMDGKVMH